jgi:hypothetical protein
MMHFARQLSWTSMALGLVACATAPTPVEAPAPQPAPAAATAPTRTRGGARLLAGADGVAQLCEELRDEDAIPFEGNDVARARARAEHERRRLEASEDTYSVEIPASGFAFRGYDLGDRRLNVDTGRNFVLADGVELVTSDREAPLGFQLSPEAAEAAIDGRPQRPALRLTFRPARSQLHRDTCVRLSGGRVVKLPVDVQAYTLVGAHDTTVAHGRVGDSPDDTPVATPHVSIAPARGNEVPDAVASAANKSLAPALLPCYRKALESRPTLRGTLVLELRVLPDGQVESPRMQMSSLGDETLVACSLAKAAHAHLAGVSSSARISLPVLFGAKEDR